MVDEEGLKELVLETRHAVPFLLRRASRQHAECFWVVLEPQHVEFIQRLKQVGNPMSALRWLEYLASDFGRLLPFDFQLPLCGSADTALVDLHETSWP